MNHWYSDTYGRGKPANTPRLPDAGRLADPRGLTDPTTLNRTGGVPTKGNKMTALKEPVAGYDSLDSKEAVASLSSHSQVELARIESYERNHENRVGVFDKLRWLRQDEPLPGYDALDVNGVVAALGKADLATLKRVRGYERKFGARKDVLMEVDRLHRERRVPLVSRDAKN